ncbi:hypothetical protein [Kibdelosporangium phytohabitans]|uniref:Gram-positive cocci surface proteins LPxTG domain-containing protein n=1 Tax=Kibdelosporangium phytohabitans TaxID=860235 RepID=A0A0N9IBP9_9PSEU|nr:hypothetical protein [Kibdelosporangium phytohabitans]ALG13668.1 hypothetical protein AOZ06_48505 [Kibdelosporangium phytohabitans]MBE1465554.1 hypothetical protein [Kibdelosporangium phytohabitans]
MRKNTLAGAVAFGIAGLFIVGGVANAEQGPGNDGRIAVGKASYKAGETVEMSGVCRMEGVAKWTVTSKAFVAPGEVRIAGQAHDGFTGTAKVGKDVKPGTYTVSFTCVDRAISANLKVVGAEQKQAKPAETTKKADGQVAVKPKGAADTGEGDVVAAPAREQGSNTGLYALGGAGLLAAGGAGAFMLRRRSRTQN